MLTSSTVYRYRQGYEVIVDNSHIQQVIYNDPQGATHMKVSPAPVRDDKYHSDTDHYDHYAD